MIECGVCGKEFEIEEEYKDHVAQAHEAMNNIYSEAFCLKKAEEKTCPSCHGSGSVSSNGETEDCPRCLGNGVISSEANANEDSMDDYQYKQQFGHDWRDDKARKERLKKEGKEGDPIGDCPSCDRHTLYGSKSGKYCTVCGYEDKDSSKEGSFDNIRKVDSLGESWGIIEKEKKAQLFESLGINQGSAYTLANLDWYNLSPQLKKDASEAYAKEEDLVIDNDEDLYALHKGIMDKPVKDDEEKEINEAYRDFYDIEKYHDSPDYKKKANEQGLDDECPFCKEKIKEPETLDWHMEQEHGVHIPSQYTQTGIQGAMADTDFDSLGSDFYSEANPNHADDGKFSSVGGSSSLNDSHKQALDKYIEKHGKEDYNVIGSLGGWDENVHLPANILKQVKGANHDEMLDYIRSKVGNEAKDRPVVEGDPVHVVSQQCFDWEGYEIDCESGERIGKGYSQSKAYQQFLNEAYDEWTCSKCGVKLPYGKSVGDHLLDHGITFEAKEEFDYNWACPRCGNKKVTTKKDEYGNPIGRSCPKCGLGNEAKAEESDYSSLSTEELQRRLQRAEDKLPTLKTQGGLWALTGEINACRKELNNRGISTGSIIESIATEAKWQCDNCGAQFEDASGASKHENETGHHDMGFSTTVTMPKSKFEEADKDDLSNDEFIQGMMGIRAKLKKKYGNKSPEELEQMGIWFGPESKAGEAIPDEAFYKTYTEEEVRALGAKNPVMDEYSGEWYWNNYVWRLQHGDDISNRDGADEAGNFLPDGSHLGVPVGYEYSCKQCSGVGMYPTDYDSGRGPKCNRCNGTGIEPGTDRTKYMKGNEARADHLLDVWNKQFGEDAPQDAEGALQFLLDNGIDRKEAVRALQDEGAYINETRANEISGQYTKECPECGKLINVDKMENHRLEEHGDVAVDEGGPGSGRKKDDDKTASDYDEGVNAWVNQTTSNPR